MILMILLIFTLVWLLDCCIEWQTALRLGLFHSQFDPWVGEIPWRRAWRSTQVFLPGEFLWTEEPGGLQSMGLQRVGHDWVTKQTQHSSNWVRIRYWNREVVSFNSLSSFLRLWIFSPDLVRLWLFRKLLAWIWLSVLAWVLPNQILRERFEFR